MGQHWFCVCQFKAVLFGLFIAKLFCSYINCVPFKWMGVGDQLLPGAAFSSQVTLEHTKSPLSCDVMLPEGSKCFQRQMSGFNYKNIFPTWTHRLVEQQRCEVERNLKKELSFQKNGSNLRSQFPKHLKHKLTSKCPMVPAVLTGQSVCLKHTSPWFAGLYPSLLARRV